MPDSTTSESTAAATVADDATTPSAIDAAIEALKAAEEAVARATAANGTAVGQPARPRFDMTRPRIIEPVPIELDKTRHLTLPLSGLMEFEEITGVNPWDNDAIFAWPPKMKVLTTLLWVGLREEDPDLTLDQARKLKGMEYGQVYYLMHCLDQCWGRNMPDPDPAPENGQPANGRTDPNPRRATPARSG